MKKQEINRTNVFKPSTSFPGFILWNTSSL